MSYKVLRKRKVKLDRIETVYDDFDSFMTRGKGKRPWQVFELNQSEDVIDWIKNPKKIRKLQPILKDLSIRLTRLARPVKILDVGCYGGYLFDYLRKFCFKNLSEFSYLGIDIDEPSIEAARKIHRNWENAQFSVGDIYNLQKDFKRNSFDIVCCYRLLIHIPFLKKTTKNFYHVAAKFIYIALLVEDEASCIKYKETDLDTGKEVFYFIRTCNELMIKKIVQELKAEYQIYSHKETHYKTLILKKLGQ